MPFLVLIVIVVIIVCVVLSNSKKKKAQKLKAEEEAYKEKLFQRVIVMTVDSYKTKKEIFEDLYDTYMNDLISDEKDKIFEKLPEMKERYKKALGKLVEISEDNTVFFTTEEQNESVPIVGKYQRESDDIIRSIPPLIDFIEIYRELVMGAYKYVDDIVTRYQYVWQCLLVDDVDDDCSDEVQKIRKAQHESCREQAMGAYGIFVQEKGWEIIEKGYPKYVNQANYDKFMDMAENNVEAISEWFNIWVEKFKEIDSEYKYGMVFHHLYHFINDTNDEFGNPEWFSSPTLNFQLMFESSFPLLNAKEYDREELMRIRELYISGQMKGRYYKFSDPKYKV